MTTYTHGHHESVLRSHRWRTAENSAAHLLPWLKSGDSVLDVGCGPGTITADLATRVTPGRTTRVCWVKNAGCRTVAPAGVVITAVTVTPIAGSTPGGGVRVNSKNG